MTTTVTIASATDMITFYPTPDINGWVYNNATLDAWYALPKVEAKNRKRPNAHGSYGLGRTFTGSALPVISGQRFDVSPASALAARNRLSAMFNDGDPVTMSVADELGTTTREAWLLDFFAPFLYDFAHFPLDLAFEAPDPRRYGATFTTSDGMPAGGTGLVWNLGTAVSGLYLDWGTAGTLGQVAYTNTGNATTYPRLGVGGAGAFADGFRVTEIETGRELIVNRTTNFGEIIVLDSRTQRATLNSADVTGDLSSRDWFEIPKGATRRYQVNPLGAVSGAPTITIYAAPASL